LLVEAVRGLWLDCRLPEICVGYSNRGRKKALVKFETPRKRRHINTMLTIDQVC